jgi:hypothetical protein
MNGASGDSRPSGDRGWPPASGVDPWASTVNGGSRGSSPWASTDLPPDEVVLGDPALAPLLGALTTGPTPGELAGQDAALAMYRAARAPGPHAARLRGWARGAGSCARGAHGRVRSGMLAAVTSLAVLASGFASAHWLLGFPDASHGAVAGGREHPAHVGPASPGGSGGHSPRDKPGSPQTVPNGQRPSPSGHGTRLMPQVSLRLRAGKHDKRGVLLVRCQFTAPGDVVWLQVRRNSKHPGYRPSARWQTEAMARLSKHGKALFEITDLRADRAYRVVVLATAAHGRSVSKVIVVSARDLPWRP